MTVNLSTLENLPAYESHDSKGASVWDALEDQPDALQPSIENGDEGIEMNDNLYSHLGNPYGNSSWNFAGLAHNAGEQRVSGTGSDVDEAASDVGQHNSSAGSDLLAERLHEFAETPAEDEEGNFIDQIPVPDLSEEDEVANIAMAADMLEGLHSTGRQSTGRGFQPIFQATPQFEVQERLEVEEPETTEIHLDDNEDLKMD